MFLNDFLPNDPQVHSYGEKYEEKYEELPPLVASE